LCAQVFDKTHQTSHLVSQVMEQAERLRRMRTDASSMNTVDRAAQSEVTRRQNAGKGLSALTGDFDNTLAQQYERVHSMDMLRKFLKKHAGACATTGTPGRPFVENMEEHMTSVFAYAQLRGDRNGSCGGTHPLSPEWVFNAKRTEALSYGLVGLDGELLDVCDEQLDPTSYFPGAFDQNAFEKGAPHSIVEKSLRFVAPNIGIESMWLATRSDQKSPLGMSMPRVLSGSATPGPYLMRVFLELEARDKAAAEGLPPPALRRKSDIDARAYERLRGRIARRDNADKKDATEFYMSLVQFDALIPSGSGPNTPLSEAYVKGNVCPLDEVRAETTRIQELILQRFVNSFSSELEEKHAKISARVAMSNEDAICIDTDKLRLEKEKEWLVAMHSRARKDLVRYYLRRMEACFQSSTEQKKIPPGWLAMFQGLQKGVDNNSGSLSVAWNGGEDKPGGGRAGRQLLSADRTTFGEFKETMRFLWVECAKIEGRDCDIMEAMYITSFEVYTDKCFPLIVSSGRGKGKSVRADRLKQLLPEGMCTSNSANSARSGMNGNLAPSDGTVVICDEMMSDLTPNDPGERQEFYKQIWMNREYHIERTMDCLGPDGTKHHKTVKLRTSHHESLIVCTNDGSCFTTGSAEPSASKYALIQRTVALHVRQQTTRDVPDKTFREYARQAMPAAAIRDFRLLTCIAGFVRLAMFRMPFLMPDTSFASRLFFEFDRIINEERNIPVPEARRKDKRMQDLVTLCVLNATWMVFGFQQTAANIQGGQPTTTGTGKLFDITQLYDVIRLSHPTRELIVYAWSQSLEYSIGTSTAGSNVFTGICELAGIQACDLWKQLPNSSMDELLAQCGGEPLGGVMESGWVGSPHNTDGATPAYLHDQENVMRKERQERNRFRRDAIKRAPSESSRPIEAITQVVGDERAPTVINAVLPSFALGAMFWTMSAVVQWSAGKLAQANSVRDIAIPNPQLGQLGAAGPSTDASTASSQTSKNHVHDLCKRLAYAEVETRDGGSKAHNLAWLKVDADGREVRDLAQALQDVDIVKTMDLHVEACRDLIRLLSNSENKRICSQQPKYLPRELKSHKAFTGHVCSDWSTVDRSGRTFSSPDLISDPYIGVTKFFNDVDPAAGPSLRLEGHAHHPSNVPVHGGFDNLNANARLPALQPFMSATVREEPPLKQSGNGFAVNVVCAYEHMQSILEATLVMARVPGCRNAQETLLTGSSPDWTKNSITRTPAHVESLPWSKDLLVMSFTVDCVERLYDSGRTARLMKVNEKIRSDFSDTSLLTNADLPQMTLRFQGYQADAQSRIAMKSLSIPIASKRRSDVLAVPMDMYSTHENTADFVPEVSKALGKRASASAVSHHVSTLGVDGNTYNIVGDVLDFQVWADHMEAAMTERGFYDGIRYDDDSPKDPVMRLLLDCEHNVELRIHERNVASRLEKGAPSLVKKAYDELSYDTYANEHLNPPDEMPSATTDASSAVRSTKRAKKDRAMAEAMDIPIDSDDDGYAFDDVGELSVASGTWGGGWR
jgi:hypothetical protein